MINLLNHINKYVQLTNEEIELFLSKVNKRTYLKDQYVVQAGDIYGHQTFVEFGIARTFYLDEKGNEHIVAFGIDNWWIGDICSFNSQKPAKFNTQCLKKTTVFQISFTNMEQLFKDIPKLERYFRIITQTAYGNMTERIVFNNAMTAKERYLLFLEKYPQIHSKVPQYMVASYLGITKEFLSSLKNNL